MTEEQASIGHNSGDMSLAEMARDNLRERLAPLKARIEQIEGSASRAYATDPASAAKCADLVKIARETRKIVEESREATKRPYLEAGRAVDELAREYTGPLSNAITMVEGKLNVYAREERARIEAEERRRAEEARQAAEAALAEQGAAQEGQGGEKADAAPVVVDTPAAKASTVRIDTANGAVVSARKVWDCEITDWPAALAALVDNENVRAAAEKAIRAQMRAGTREHPGVRFFQTTKAQVR